jgi:hypothetical protein
MNHLTSTAREITVRVKGLEQDLRNRHNAGESAREKLNDYQLAFDVRELAEVVTQLAERVDGLTQASLPVSNGHTAHAQPVHGDGGLAHIRVMLQGTDVWDEGETSAGMVARLIDQHRDLTGLVKDVRTALHPAWTDAPWDVDAVDVRNLPDEVKNLADNARELDGRIRKAMLELNPPPF